MLPWIRWQVTKLRKKTFYHAVAHEGNETVCGIEIPNAAVFIDRGHDWSGIPERRICRKCGPLRYSEAGIYTPTRRESVI